MGLKEYIRKQGGRSRMKWSAGVAVLSHALAFLVGSMSLATQAEYGMSGATAPQVMKELPPVELEVVDLLDSDEARPVRKKTPEPTPVPTPETPAAPAPSAPTTATGQAYQIPAYYRNPPPPYPAEALKLRQEGAVLLRVEVDPKGDVASVVLRQSSGFPLLDEAAQKSVAAWRFKPGRLAGIAVSTSVDIPVRFKLKD
jgi:periplasmic protein TonB